MTSLYSAPSGDNTNFVKYNAKSGRWFIRKDKQDIEIANPVFVADFANAKKAWMHFQEGQAPNVVYFDSLDAQIPQPSPNHKIGVSIMLFSKSAFGGVVKLESNSINTCKALGGLFDLYNAAPESKEGKLPVVKVTGANPIKGNYGTNYEPAFAIEKWVNRPPELDAAPAQASAPVAQAQAAPVASASEF